MKSWPLAIMVSYHSYSRRFKISKMPSTRPHSVARLRFPLFILWPCWLSRILHLPGHSTRLFKAHSNSCWRFRKITNHHSLLTRTRFSLIKVTRDPKHLHFAYSSQIRVGLIRVTVNFTQTCSTLRSVINFFLFYGKNVDFQSTNNSKSWSSTWMPRV